jgi:hypothetical protein
MPEACHTYSVDYRIKHQRRRCGMFVTRIQRYQHSYLKLWLVGTPTIAASMTNHGGKDRSIMWQVKTPATAKERHRRTSFVKRMQRN